MKCFSYAGISVLALFIVFLETSQAEGQKLPKVLIITGNGNVPTYKEEYPPWIHEFQNEMVVDILKDIATVDVTTDLGILATSRLREYDLIISNSIFLTPGEAELEGLYSFVSNGKAYMTLHCGILSLLNWDKYEEFIGGIFIGGPSTVPAEFEVVTTNREFWGYKYSFRDAVEHPISVVTDDFTTKDELYYFQPSKKEFHVIARAENHPVMWWHPVGRGRVMSLTLGHDEEAKSSSGYQELLRNGVKWLTGTPLIYADQPRPVSMRTLSYNNFMTLQGLTDSHPQNLVFAIAHNGNPEVFSVESMPGGAVNLKLKGKSGKGTFTAAVSEGAGLQSKKSFEVEVVADGTGNIASYHGNTASSSSNENESGLFSADNVLDGKMSTRWSSAATETAWLNIDLRKVYRIHKIILRWEASFATAYTIEGSSDGKKWNTLTTVTQSDGEEDAHEIKGFNARYVRINMTKRFNNKWGYSLYEVEVYGAQ